MSTQSQSLQGMVAAKAMKDSDCKKRLMANPHAALEQDFNLKFREGLNIELVEQPADTLYIVLPAAAAPVSELTDSDLASVAGGRMSDKTSTVTSSGVTVCCWG